MLNYPADFGHNNFAFNAHLNSDGTPIRSAVHATVSIDEREINTGYRDLKDPLHLGTGGTLGRIHKNMTSLRLGGRIQARDASQKADLSDKERALLAAFDPALCLRDSPTTDGAYPYNFSEPTTDTTNFPSGIMPLRYYMRPDGRPRLRAVLNEKGWRQYALALVAPDPRQYAQTESTLVLSSGTPSGNVINIGNVPAPLKVTIVLSGNGNSAFTITRSGVAFILNLSAVGASTVVVVFETCGPYGRGRYITRNGVENAALKTSGASTWLDAPIGTTNFVLSNTTAITSATFAWYAARA